MLSVIVLSKSQRLLENRTFIKDELSFLCVIKRIDSIAVQKALNPEQFIEAPSRSNHWKNKTQEVIKNLNAKLYWILSREWASHERMFFLVVDCLPGGLATYAFLTTSAYVGCVTSALTSAVHGNVACARLLISNTSLWRSQFERNHSES
jgi:hypothetical protein